MRLRIIYDTKDKIRVRVEFSRTTFATKLVYDKPTINKEVMENVHRLGNKKESKDNSTGCQRSLYIDKAIRRSRRTILLDVNDPCT